LGLVRNLRRMVAQEVLLLPIPPRTFEVEQRCLGPSTPTWVAAASFLASPISKGGSGISGAPFQTPMATPEHKVQARNVFTPPPAPSWDQRMGEFDEDIRAALCWGSLPLLTWALRGGTCSCNCGSEHSIHEAVSREQPEALEFLLAHGSLEALDALCGGNSPLHLAVRKAHFEGDVGYTMASMLLQHGACPDQMLPNGTTPLHEAVGRSSEPAVRLLLEHGANPNRVNEMGMTPLHLACRRPSLVDLCAVHSQVVAALLQGGADPLQPDAAGLRPAAYLAASAAAVPQGLRGPTTTSLTILLHAEALQLRRRARRGALLLRARPECQHILSRMPEDVFQAVVRFL